MDDRNRPLADDELDALFPQEGYKVRVGVVCGSAHMLSLANNMTLELKPGSQYDAGAYVASVKPGSQYDAGA